MRNVLREVFGWFKAHKFGASRVFPSDTSLLALDGFRPNGFRYGVEILNDERTPMEFVVSMLEGGVGLDRTTAVRTMLDIHERGGIVLSLGSEAEAMRVAEAVTSEARKREFPLVCRAVKSQE